MEQNNKIIFPDIAESSLAIINLDNKKHYKKECCNNEKLKEQQHLLRDVILSNGKQDFFTVFDMRCATGKTHIMINTIPYYLQEIAKGNLPRQGILIVLRQTEECHKYTEYLNQLYSSSVALEFHSKEYKCKDIELSKMLKQELLKKVPYKPVVFITHENYINLAEDKKTRKTFTEGRRLLIIDESVNICEIMKVTTIQKEKEDVTFRQIKQISNILIEDEKEMYEEMCKPLLDKFEEIEKNIELKNVSFNFKIENKEKLNKKIDKFLKNIVPTYPSELKNSIERTLKTIKLLYNDTCIINKTKDTLLKQGYIEIKTINRDKKMWTLDNSIILDASASIDPRYELNKDLYYMMNNECVLDYSRWKLEYVFENSTKTSKLLNKEFVTQKEIDKLEKKYNGYSQIIKDLGETETLVVCSRDEHIRKDNKGNEEKYNPYILAKNLPLDNIVHFGNITGKRDFWNLKNVLIAHTPNLQDSDYILYYMYYTNTHFEDNQPNLQQSPIPNLSSIYMFDNQELQETKEKIIANQIYQAVCRVNREMKEETKVIIVCKYIGAILYVRDMLQGCKCEQTDKYNEIFGTGINKVNEERKEKSQENTLKKIFKEILSGKIRKEIEYTVIDPYIIKIHRKSLLKVLNFSDKQFSDSITDNKEFLKENAIIYKQKIFTFILNEPIEKANS